MADFDPDEFVRELFDAAFDDEAFDATMGKLAREAFGSAHATEFGRVSEIDTDLVTGSDFDFALGAAARELEPEENPGLAAVATAAPGKPFQLGSFLDLTSLSEDGGTRRLFDPHGWDKVLLARLPSDGPGVSHLTFFRRRSDPEFTSDHEALLAKLAPFVSSAARLRNLRIASERREMAMRNMADIGRSAESMMILSPGMRVLDLDPIARKLLDEGEALRLQGGRLVSASKHAGEDTPALEAFLRNAAAAPGAPPLRVRGRLGRVFRLTAFPVGPDVLHHLRSTFGSAICLCVETQPKPMRVDLESFALAYDLTKGEARFLGALVEAASAAEAAQKLSMSRNTAKSHLSSIFRKTETSNQSQLMLLLGGYR